MDSGIAKLVGDALGSVQSSEVTMAIATWGVVRGRSRLHEKGSLYSTKRGTHSGEQICHPSSCPLFLGTICDRCVAWGRYGAA